MLREQRSVLLVLLSRIRDSSGVVGSLRATVRFSEREPRDP